MRAASVADWLCALWLWPCRLGGVVPRTTNLANHGGKVTGAVVSGGDKLRTVGFDDKMRTATISTHTYDQPELALPGQPIR